MASRNPVMKSAGNLDTESERVCLEHMSFLSPISPTCYEHCFVTRLNPDDGSECAQFAVQAIYYLPTFRQTSQINESVNSSLTKSQRDVLHHILEDRNGRTAGNGRWVLAGLEGAGTTLDGERSEDFEMTIVYCETGKSINRRFNRPYPAMTSDGGDGAGARDPELQESEEDWEGGQITGAKMNKGKHVMGRENANMGQGWNSSSQESDKNVPQMRGAVSLKMSNNQGLGLGDILAKDSGRGTTPSETLRFPMTRLDENYDGGRAAESATFSLPNTHQVSVEIVESAAPSPSLPTAQAAAALQWKKPSSMVSESHATPSALCDPEQQQPSKRTDQTQKERLPTLTPPQLAEVYQWALDLRKKRLFPQALLLLRLVWYCRELLIGPFDFRSLTALQQLATTYDASGQKDLAAIAREVLKSRNPTSFSGGLALPAPPLSVSELSNAHRLALELRRRKVFNRAISLFTIVWYASDMLVGECHGSSRSAINELAVTYNANGQPDMAKRLREELTERRERK